MVTHLQKCQKRQAQQQASGGKSKPTTLYHLLVEGRHLPEYWMHIELPASEILGHLDQFLRNTWLECCGHLSAFEIAGQRYSVAPMDEFGFEDLHEENMDFTLGEVLRPGMTFEHEYDFGTTTELKLKVVSMREGQIKKGKRAQILARNNPPPIPCSECEQPATNVCSQCIYDDAGWLCDEHSATHECGEDYLLPVVNSPRVGMCGYVG